MPEINSNFIQNTAVAKNGTAKAGAFLFVDEENIQAGEAPADALEKFNGVFYSNKAIGKNAHGGALYTSSLQNRFSPITGATIGDVNAEFIANGVEATEQAVGGAVYNGGVIKQINANFVANYAQSEIGNTYGGAFANVGNSDYGTKASVKGNFIDNYATSTDGNIYGGALYNGAQDFTYDSSYFGTINSVANIVLEDSNLLNNYAQTTNGNAYGGAIYTDEAEITMVDLNSKPVLAIAHVKNNDGTTAQSFYAILNSHTGIPIPQEEIKALIADGTYTEEFSVYIEEEISMDDFINSFGDGTYEGSMQIVTEMGYMTSNPNDLFKEFAQGNDSEISINSVRISKASLNLNNTNLIGNHAKSENGEAKGGAIYSKNTNVKINANNGHTTLISGNYTQNGNVVDDNAIYMNSGKLIFDVTSGSTIQLDDNINGENYETYIIGDNSSNFILNNKIKNSTTHLIDTNLYLAKDSNLDGNNLSLHSGMLSMVNNQAGESALNSLTVTGDTNVLVDVDLKNQTMDRFTALEYGSHNGNLNVTGMNLLSDAVNNTTEILFAEQDLKDNITNGITSQLPDDKYQTTLFTPIYKYNVSYDNRDDAGYFVFARQSSGSNNQSAVFNPAVLGSSTSATVGAMGTINQSFNYAFSNVDTHMNIPYLERISMRDRNKYALSITGDATDMGRFSPLYQPSQEESSIWVKPYTTFENVPLKNGPKVSNITYGTLIGFDTEIEPLKHGWDRVWTGYIGYNGASQSYAGIDSTQNGGLLGATMSLYKGNFFNATTVSVGASIADNQTMYGNEDFTMLLSGIGNKTGYNIEFEEGKLILQPSMLISYTFVNTFDYTNAAGVRIDNKPLHALQLTPGVKVIGNSKSGWQPYASVSMVWNLMGESKATANGVKLPEMSIKPYVQYGVGVQKRIKDHFMAYGQAMVQNGGRNGISLTSGFRWALGHNNCKYEKVEKDEENIKSVKVLKQMTPPQLKTMNHNKHTNISHSVKSEI